MAKEKITRSTVTRLLKRKRLKGAEVGRVLLAAYAALVEGNPIADAGDIEKLCSLIIPNDEEQYAFRRYRNFYDGLVLQRANYEANKERVFRCYYTAKGSLEALSSGVKREYDREHSPLKISVDQQAEIALKLSSRLANAKPDSENAPLSYRDCVITTLSSISLSLWPTFELCGEIPEMLDEFGQKYSKILTDKTPVSGEVAVLISDIPFGRYRAGKTSSPLIFGNRRAFEESGFDKYEKDPLNYIETLSRNERQFSKTPIDWRVAASRAATRAYEKKYGKDMGRDIAFGKLTRFDEISEATSYVPDGSVLGISWVAEKRPPSRGTLLYWLLSGGAETKNGIEILKEGFPEVMEDVKSLIDFGKYRRITEKSIIPTYPDFRYKEHRILKRVLSLNESKIDIKPEDCEGIISEEQIRQLQRFGAEVTFEPIEKSEPLKFEEYLSSFASVVDSFNFSAGFLDRLNYFLDLAGDVFEVDLSALKPSGIDMNALRDELHFDIAKTIFRLAKYRDNAEQEALSLKKAFKFDTLPPKGKMSDRLASAKSRILELKNSSTEWTSCINSLTASL